MNNNLNNVWVQLTLQQFFNYRRATAVVTESIKTSGLPGGQSRVDSQQLQIDESLNPMEFHGRRRPKWPPRPQVGTRMA